MPNKRQEKLLRKSPHNWNRWRVRNPTVEIDLKGASLMGIDLRGINLSYTDLDGANLSNANLAQADLSHASLIEANLSGANLSQANLESANLRGSFLTSTNLERVNAKHCCFSGTMLNQANFTEADLSEADFIQAQALGTNFSKATLTGACIQDWNTNPETCLIGVKCDYIFRKWGQQERRPHDPNKNFASGEFTLLVQKGLYTIDLIFRNEVNWTAFAYSLKKAQVISNNTNLTVQSIENKGDGVFIIRVDTPLDANKPKIERDFWQGYEFAQQCLEPQYNARLEDKNKQINQLFYLLNQAQEKLGEIPKLMSEQPKVQQNFHDKVYGVAGNVEGNQNLYISEEKQSLAEATAEIQQLLQQLEQTNPTATGLDKQAFVSAALPLTRKQRLISAVKEGGKAALQEFLDNPYLNTAMSIIEGWKNPDIKD